MNNRQSPGEIRRVAAELDSAVENKDTEKLLSSFADDCEIELLGQKLIGKEGVKKWSDWLYKNLSEIRFEPVKIMVAGDTFFEEFVLKARLKSGVEIRSKQTEVLLYEDYKIKSLRLYFDRLDFAEAIAGDPISKTLVKKLIRKSIAGITRPLSKKQNTGAL